MPDHQPALSPAERVENALRSSKLRTANAARVLANAKDQLGLMQAETKKARGRLEVLRANREAQMAAMRKTDDHAA